MCGFFVWLFVVGFVCLSLVLLVSLGVGFFWLLFLGLLFSVVVGWLMFCFGIIYVVIYLFWRVEGKC